MTLVRIIRGLSAVAIYDERCETGSWQIRDSLLHREETSIAALVLTRPLNATFGCYLGYSAPATCWMLIARTIRGGKKLKRGTIQELLHCGTNPHIIMLSGLSMRTQARLSLFATVQLRWTFTRVSLAISVNSVYPDFHGYRGPTASRQPYRGSDGSYAGAVMEAIDVAAKVNLAEQRREDFTFGCGRQKNAIPFEVSGYCARVHTFAVPRVGTRTRQVLNHSDKELLTLRTKASNFHTARYGAKRLKFCRARAQ